LYHWRAERVSRAAASLAAAGEAEALARGTLRGVPEAAAALQALAERDPVACAAGLAALRRGQAGGPFERLLDPNPIWFRRRAVRWDPALALATLARLTALAHGSDRFPVPAARASADLPRASCGGEPRLGCLPLPARAPHRLPGCLPVRRWALILFLAGPGF